MSETVGWKGQAKAGGIALLSFGAVLGGMLVREAKSVSNRIPTFETLVASRDIEQIHEDDYFTEIAQILRSDYVDPIEDEMKLATGAIKGMVGSLSDPDSLYYDTPEMRVMLRSLRGQFEGVGLSLGFRYSNGKDEDTDQRIPRVVVRYVVAGSSAAKAGIQVGDVVESVDGHWVINSEFIDRAKDIQEKVQAKKLPVGALDDLRKEVRDKFDGAIAPMRAWKRLMMGTEGSTKVSVLHGENQLTFSLSRGTWTKLVPQGSTPISFLPGTEKQLSPQGQNKKFDLRGMACGDYPTMLAMLKSLGVTGNIGTLVKAKKAASPVAIKGGGSQTQSVTILVDQQTSGVPEIFARVMEAKGAKIEGKSAGRLVATQIVLLPDNAGYTLNLGTFRPAVKK